MPTEAQIKAAATRRRQRKENREANVQKAHDQEKNLSATLAANKENPKPAPKPQPTTKRERVQQGRRVAEKKADEQERNMKPAEIDTKAFLDPRRSGRIPLHVLNRMSQQNEADARNEARQIANAAGKAAFDAYQGRRTGGDTRNRHAKAAAAQRALATQQDK